MPDSKQALTSAPNDVHRATRRHLLQGMGASLALLGMPGALAAMGSTAKADIKPFTSVDEIAAKLAKEFKLSPQYVQSALGKAEFVPSIIRRMQTPYESRPYTDYRPLFVNDRLAGLGKQYLQQHRKLFTATEKKYGVEAEIIAAILGMETHYGRSRGKDSVLSSLYTLASGYPRRADFFRSELGHFLLLCQEEKFSPEKPLGSYAGAFGTTQFIPSSYRHFAVDADGDGHRDVWDSTPDILASVGNYFHEHRWKAGKPVALWLPQPVSRQAYSLREQAKKGLKNWKTVADFSKDLPALPEAWSSDDKVTIIEMETRRGRELALVHYNFYVITRWNRSYNYAMAITELSDLLGCELCQTRA
ncbi:MAG: lytic murein transglycosylase B [Mariprofundaceae bacterium]|nr:lytic murein transglycosylase B [Mariprofundaceae bacterium]